MKNGTSQLAVPGVIDLEWIGAGGFGAVYRGFQPDFDRPVAVKVLQVNGVDRKTLQRFKRERQLMGRLSSMNRNVVLVLDSGTLPDGRPFLVTEFCAGGSLAKAEPMSVRQVAEIGRKIVAALILAHRDGIVHRDIKPANIMLRADGEPALGDFGLSIRPAHDQSQGLDALAPEYAAPESLRDGQYDSASDIYALGATLYALLNGAPPFPRRADEATLAYLMRVVSDPVPPPRRAADAPADLLGLLAEMLAKEPANRPEATAVGNRLTAVCTQLPADQPLRPAAESPVGNRPGGRWLPGGEPANLLPAADGWPVAVGRQALLDQTGIRVAPAPPAPVRSRRTATRLAGALTVAALVATGGWLVTDRYRQPSAAIPQRPDAAAPGSQAARPAASGSPAPRPRAGARQPAVVLARPTDDGNRVRLTWSGAAGLQYAVVVGEPGRPAQTTLVGRGRSTAVPVTAGRPYCFRVQATDGHGLYESNVQAIRRAVCRFR